MYSILTVPVLEFDWPCDIPITESFTETTDELFYLFCGKQLKNFACL